jgi:hypothetical protein
MATRTASAEELYPSARELFRPEAPRPRPRRPALAWLVAGALAAVLGRRLLHWLDRNL